MITAKSIVELLEKEKFITYFVLLWAGSLFFWNLSSLAYYIFHLNTALSGLALLSNLMEFLAGIMLGLLGFALLGMHFLKMFTKEKLLIFFLLFWAASFFLWGIYEIVDFGPMSIEAVFRLLGALCDLGAGAILALFGLKLFNKEQATLPPPP